MTSPVSNPVKIVVSMVVVTALVATTFNSEVRNTRMDCCFTDEHVLQVGNLDRNFIS
jgi:hypothetical protein